ncbi:MAG: MFS transporter [Aggregatilineales bacterium]
MSSRSISTPQAPVQHSSSRPLYMALVGTFFLRAGGGIMGILIGLYLSAKNAEMSSGPTPNKSYVIPATLVGIILASYFITELGGSFISGSLIDRHGPKRYMIFGPVFGAIAVFITAALHLRSDSPVPQFILFIALLFATRLLEGASGATTNPATLAYIAAYTDGDPKLRSRISGYFELATLIGAASGFVFGGMLWNRFGQASFLLDAGVYLFSGLIFFFGVRNIISKGAAHTESHDLRAYLKLVRSPRLRELIPAWLAVSGLLGVLFNQVTLQLSNGSGSTGSDGVAASIDPAPGQMLSHAFNGGQVGMVFGLYAAAFGIGIVLWTGIIPRMRKSTAMLIAAGGVITSSVIIALINHTGPLTETNWLRAPLIVLMCLAVMVESGFTPAALVYLSDLSELHAESRGMVMGLYSFLLGFGQVLGSVIAGPFADKAAIDGLLLFMAILGLISVGGVLLLRHDELITHEGLGPASAPPPTKVPEAAAD